jgi:multiple sugar transport system permease protein
MAVPIEMKKVTQEKRRRMPSRLYLTQGAMHLVLFIMCALAIAPFIWTVFASFKPFRELVSSTALLPQTWTLNSYREIFTRAHFLTAVQNSAITAVTVTLATLITSSATGYVFAKYRFWGKEFLFTILLSTMMVPFAVVLVPLYITINEIGMGNSLGGLIITGLWSTFGIFLMRQFMETIPDELMDAARIDSAAGSPRHPDLPGQLG